MKRYRQYFFVFMLLLIVCIAYCISHRPFMRSVSELQGYEIDIYTREGIGLWNVPTYVTILVKKQDDFFVRTQIQEKINNDDNKVIPDHNILILWDDGEQLVRIVLLGYEQQAKVISVELSDKTSYTRESLSSSEVKSLMLQNGVDISVLEPGLLH